MEDPRISQQQVAQPLSGTEALPVVQQSGVTGKFRTLRTDINALKDYLVKDFVNALYPAGAVVPYAGSIVDGSMGNWLPCDGRSVALSAYPRLYNSIGKTYGSLDANSFNLPDLRGRVIMGYCNTSNSQTFDFGKWNSFNSVSVGSTEGSYNVKLQKSNLPINYISFPFDKIDKPTPGYVQHDHPLNTWTCTPRISQFNREFDVPAVGAFRVTANIRTNGATWTQHKMQYKVGLGDWIDLYAPTGASTLNLDSGFITGSGKVSIRACVYRASGQNDDARMWIENISYYPTGASPDLPAGGVPNGSIIQDVGVSTAVDGSDYLIFRGNSLSVSHRNWQQISNISVNQRTVNGSTGSVISSNGSTGFGPGGGTLPFNILQTTNVQIVNGSKTGRSSISITSKPTQQNNYTTTVLIDDDGPPGRTVQTFTLRFIRDINIQSVVTGSAAAALANITQPYMALNYIIKY